MEEFILNENMINELPSCVGLLRQLHTMIADCNKLDSLPISICSCINLRILSLSDNCITDLPDDIGRLSSLQVLNLCNNRISYLPFSLTKIVNLKSLWLSENQNKPLIQLHSEYGPNDPYQKVLTCVLLPQTKPDESITINVPNNGGGVDDAKNSSVPTRRKSSFLIASIDKPLIHFNLGSNNNELNPSSTNGDNDNPGEDDLSGVDDDSGRLLRQPTPYPKDLKVHARHARNLVLKHLDLGNINLESVDKLSEGINSGKTY